MFPREACGLRGKKGTFGGTVVPYRTFPDQPVRSCATACRAVKKSAGIECRWHDPWHSAASRMAAGGILLVRQLSLSFRANLRRRRKCSSVKFPRLQIAEDVPYSRTIQCVGGYRLRRAVGTFRNVIVARWACKLLKMWWPETGSNRRRRPFQGRALPLSYLAFP